MVVTASRQASCQSIRLGWAAWQVPKMTVGNARTLHRAGITSPDALAQSSANDVAQALATGLAKVICHKAKEAWGLEGAECTACGKVALQ